MKLFTFNHHDCKQNNINWPNQKRKNDGLRNDIFFNDNANTFKDCIHDKNAFESLLLRLYDICPISSEDVFLGHIKLNYSQTICLSF